jgi:hypothetical protein
MLKTKKDELSMYPAHKRLPSLPTSSVGIDPSRPGKEPLRPSSRARSSPHEMPQSMIEMSRAKQGGVTEEKILEMREAIRSGMRVIILKEPLKDDFKDFKDAACKKQSADDVSKEAALKVYFKYQELLEMDGGSEDIGDDDDCDAKDHDDEAEEDNWAVPRKSRKAFAAEQGFNEDLMPISWASFLLWVQREYDFAGHFRYKAMCSALMRALKRWREWEASPAQRFYGVSLSMMFQLMFPSLLYQDMAQLFTWIALYEIERIRQPTPRVLEPEDRRHLESIFHTMDTTGRGYVTAKDIAGGSQDMDQRLNKNVVDEDTVKLVFGDKPLDLQAYLEMMCEDNFRANENSKVAIFVSANQYGSHMQIRKLVEVNHPVVSFTGWMYDPTPKEEETPRRLIKAIEDEVSKWRKLSHSRRTRLADVHSGGHVFF